ncbi:MAG: hypothetical protein ACMZI0_11800 [Symbiopectobacterium sp.]|uniref:hypothetical protein n=1 Tax=Symbiopectobacterium sp. TaxID=2952789 RepID=UPI0039E940DF
MLVGGVSSWVGYHRYCKSEYEPIYGVLNENSSLYISSKLYSSQQNHIYYGSVNLAGNNTKNRTRKRHVVPNEKTRKDSEIKDDITTIKLTDCREQRENLALPDILRVVSKTIRYPISSLIDEGRIVLNYNVYGQGCVDNSKFNQISSKIENAVNLLLSWIPMYNRTRLITMMTATVLDMIADSLEHKELSVSYVNDIEDNIINLTKDMISSLSTLQVNNIINNGEYKQIKSIMNDVRYKNNKLIIRTRNPVRDVPVKDYFGHFIDEKKGRYVFYNKHNQWAINKNIQFNHEVRKIKELIDNAWNDQKDVFF